MARWHRLHPHPSLTYTAYTGAAPVSRTEAECHVVLRIDVYRNRFLAFFPEGFFYIDQTVAPAAIWNLPVPWFGRERSTIGKPPMFGKLKGRDLLDHLHMHAVDY